MTKTPFAAAAFALLASATASAASIDLYVDSQTQQLYSQPGPGRVKLGTFVPQDDKAATSAAPSAPAAASVPVAAKPATPAEKKWFDKLALRGYTQIRFNQELGGDAQELRSPGDRFIGENQSLGIRRARVILSGDVSEHLSIYIQPDFASTPAGSSTGNFAQLRDVYADLFFDKDHEYRIRAGQSKIPYGWENLQSSQNRLTPDRADALNSAVRDERDLALIFYWEPKEIAGRFRDLVRSGLKGSGDYGVIGFGAYNGQGANRLEANDSLHTVAHVSYPFKFESGQYFEVGVDAYTGFFRSATGSATINGNTFTPTLAGRQRGPLDQRVSAHFIYYPQPFGLQGEWTVGSGPQLDTALQTVTSQSLKGGYLQAMYRIQSSHGDFVPFVKYQTFDGGSKFDTNAPRLQVDEVEAGLEWQIVPEIEVTTAYSYMDRTNVGSAPYRNQSGNLLRVQLQFNY